MLPIQLIQQLDVNSSEYWSRYDFILAAILVLVFGLALKFLIQKVKTRKNRILLIFGLVFFFILLWAELAGGVFNSCVAGD